MDQSFGRPLSNDPIGLFGRIYWYCVYPLHALVFQDMIDSIARRGMRQSAVRPSVVSHRAPEAEREAMVTAFKRGSSHRQELKAIYRSDSNSRESACYRESQQLTGKD